MFQLKAAEGCAWTSDSPGNPAPLSPKSTAAFLQHSAELAVLLSLALQHKDQAGVHSSGRRWSDPYPSGKTLPSNTQKALWRRDCCHPHINDSAEPFWDCRDSGRSEPNSLGIINGAEPGIAAKERRKLFSKEYRKFYCGQSYQRAPYMILGLILHGQSKKTHKVCSGAPAEEELPMLSGGGTAGLGKP